MKKRKIYLAVKNYESPDSFLKYGLSLAKTLDHPVQLLHVEKMPVTPMHYGTTGQVGTYPTENIVMDDVVEIVETKMKKLATSAQSFWPHTEYQVEVGFPEPMIESVADEDRPYLLLIEGHNDSSTINELFGTSETRMVDNIDTPMLVVPENYSWTGLNNILFAIHAEDDTTVNIDTVAEIVKRTNANLNVTVITKDRETDRSTRYVELRNEIKQKVGSDRISYSQIEEDKVLDLVSSLVDLKTLDWLIFNHKEAGFFKRLFNDNLTTSKIVLESKIPVLVQ